MSFEMIKQAFIRDGGGRLQEMKGFLLKVGAPNRGICSWVECLLGSWCKDQ